MSLVTTVIPMTQGTNQSEGSGEQWSIVFDGTWRECDRPMVILTNQQGVSTTLGLGDINSLTPSFLLTLRQKVYAACGETLAFSAVDEPTQFQDREIQSGEDADAPGNGLLTPGNNYGTPETIQALANYQGKLAIINRNSTQIWAVDVDPNNNEQHQILENIGTFAPLSVQSIGQLDVMMLSDSGFRSLRVRDSSNNAIVIDIGTPVDELVQALLASLTEVEKAGACGIVEPSANRYWCFIPGSDGGEGVIFVLSYFPTSQVVGWSQYRPTYQDAAVPVLGSATFDEAGEIAITGLTNGGTYSWTPGEVGTSLTVGATTYTEAATFTASATTGTLHGTAEGTNDATLDPANIVFSPSKFVVRDGRVYARATGLLLRFGGVDGNSYENCGVELETPWMDTKNPGTKKAVNGLDVSCQGKWAVSIAADPATGQFVPVYARDNATNASSWGRGRQAVMTKGTHLKLKMVETGTGYARFSAAAIHYNPEDAP